MKIGLKSWLFVLCAALCSTGVLSAKCKDGTCAQMKKAKQQELEAAEKKAEELAASLEKQVENVAELEALGESEEIAESISRDTTNELEEATR